MNFTEWFEKQYGKRPVVVKASDEELRIIISEGLYAEKELQKREEYDAVLRLAYYAWNIKDQDKD